MEFNTWCPHHTICVIQFHFDVIFQPVGSAGSFQDEGKQRQPPQLQQQKKKVQFSQGKKEAKSSSAKPCAWQLYSSNDKRTRHLLFPSKAIVYYCTVAFLSSRHGLKGIIMQQSIYVCTLCVCHSNAFGEYVHCFLFWMPCSLIRLLKVHACLDTKQKPEIILN